MKAPTRVLTRHRAGWLGEMARPVWLLLAAWFGGSLAWIAYWVDFFSSYCDFDGTFACILGGFLETVFYSLPQVLIRVFAPPACALLLGLGAYWAVKARTASGGAARERSGNVGQVN